MSDAGICNALYSLINAVSRVSAFAKRRKLNGDSTAPTSGSDDSSSVSLTKDVKFSKGVTRGVSSTKPLRKKTTDIVHLERNDERDSDGDENSFAPLVDAKAVSFTGTREIESFEDNSCRVRLSKGQVCEAIQSCEFECSHLPRNAVYKAWLSYGCKKALCA